MRVNDYPPYVGGHVFQILITPDQASNFAGLANLLFCGLSDVACEIGARHARVVANRRRLEAQPHWAVTASSTRSAVVAPRRADVEAAAAMSAEAASKEAKLAAYVQLICTTCNKLENRCGVDVQEARMA